MIDTYKNSKNEIVEISKMKECFRNVIQQLNERAVAAGYAPLVVECYNDIAADPQLQV